MSTLCNPIDGSPPGSLVPGILQAGTLEWVAISFSNAWKWKVKGKSLSGVRPFTTPWTAAYQAPPSMGFSRQEHWSGPPVPSPRVKANSLKITELRKSKRNGTCSLMVLHVDFTILLHFYIVLMFKPLLVVFLVIAEQKFYPNWCNW